MRRKVLYKDTGTKSVKQKSLIILEESTDTTKCPGPTYRLHTDQKQFNSTGGKGKFFFQLLYNKLIKSNNKHEMLHLICLKNSYDNTLFVLCFLTDLV